MNTISTSSEALSRSKAIRSMGVPRHDVLRQFALVDGQASLHGIRSNRLFVVLLPPLEPQACFGISEAPEFSLGAAADRGFDAALTKDQRMFLYLPFEHAEDRQAQARSVALTASLGDPELQKWGEAHKAVVDRFGRFPHRNSVLGLISTAEEIKFLKQPDNHF
jgi:hypothetical protein